MSDYGNDLRKITRYDELKKAIKQAQQTADQAEKLALEARRSIVYINSNTGVVSGAVNGAVGVVKPTGNGGTIGDASSTGLQEGAASAANSAVSTSGGSSGLADAKPDNTDRQGFYDAQSLLDGAKDGYGKIPPVSAALDAASQIVRSITGLKDETGRNIVLHAVDAALQFLAPDDRESAFASGNDPSYTGGRVWAIISGGTKYFANTFNGMIGVRAAVDLTKAYGFAGGAVTGIPENGSDIIFSSNFAAEIGDNPGGTIYEFQPYGATLSIPIGRYGQQDCGVDPGDTTACAASPPPATTWGDIGFTQLGWVSPLTGGISPYSYALMGRWVSHVYDENVPQRYKDGISNLNLFLADGTTPVTVQPLENGGLAMFYGTNTPEGDATANSIYTLGVNRSPTGYITPNQLAKMLPK